jgi:hypothetical protein
MPTGYTAIIEDRADCTFEDYVWRCARAFGAFVLMRDEALDAPIPKAFEPSDYHVKELAKATRRLAGLRAMPIEQADALAKEEYAQAVREHAKDSEQQKLKLARYDAILAKVKAWDPPTPQHQELKKFMEQQIDVSTEFDRQYVRPEPELLTGAQWLEKEIKSAQWSFDYHTKEDAEERERTAGRNGWVKALAASVPIPPSLTPEEVRGGGR